MKRFRLITTYLALIMLGAVSSAVAKPDHKSSAVAWVQHSAEYQAVVKQTLKSAAGQLRLAKRDKRWTAMLEQFDRNRLSNFPDAVIINLEDGLISSAPYHAQLVDDGDKHTASRHKSWVNHETAPLTPGMMEFIQAAASLKVKVLIMSNRKCVATPRDECPIKTQTQRMLRKHNLVFPDEQMFFLNEKSNWKADKKTRREYLAKRYRVLMIIGDDVADMLPNLRKLDNKMRARYVEQYANMWGSHWFILPNPYSGTWATQYGNNFKRTLQGWD